MTTNTTIAENYKPIPDPKKRDYDIVLGDNLLENLPHYTLSVIFNKKRTKVLTCWHKKQQTINFIGGKIEPGEGPMQASYRELQEETGIAPDDIKLKEISTEISIENECKEENKSIKRKWSIYLTAGILEHDTDLIPEKNSLEWTPVFNPFPFLSHAFDGNLYCFLLKAMRHLGISNMPEDDE